MFGFDVDVLFVERNRISRRGEGGVRVGRRVVFGDGVYYFCVSL